MKSKIAEKISNETPDSVKEEVRNYANLIVENERLKTELAEVKRFLQEMYSNSNYPGSNYTIPTLWRQRIERFVN